MKIFNLASILILSASLAAAAPKKDNGSRFTINTASSVLKWNGTKVTGAHNGTVMLKSGHVMVNKGAVTGGEFEIDMNTIGNNDMAAGSGRDKLVAHLKSDDFFGVEKYPAAKFKITKVKAFPKAKPDGSTHNVSGDLTIKGITKPVAFPAKIKIDGNRAEASGKISVDRTLWDIRYGSGKFFKNIGDKAIHDNFDIELNLKAAK